MNNDTPDNDRTVVPPPLDGPPGEAPAAAVPPPLPGRQDSGNALPLGTFLDEFELKRVAGEGGFSIVYRAWDHSLKRQVAVKEYFPSGMVGRSGGTQVVVRSERHTEAFEAGLRSFVEEARLLAQFDHPALIKVYRFWKANGSAYMVMPFCEGITLRDEWKSLPEPPDEMALMTLLDPLTEALSVLHAERWYHRDIAPDNVMLLAGTRRPLLLDFGAARQVIGDLTHALTVILKPGYAPIEQWGEVPGMKQGPWTDVYALAATIHFGITGRTPPPSVGRLINDGYEPLAQIAAGRYSARFLVAVDRALAVRPEERTPSIEQFRDELGLNEFTRERTQTWLPPGAVTQLQRTPTTIYAAPLVPDVELATAAPGEAAAPPPFEAALADAAPQFTVRPGETPFDFEARTQPLRPQPPPKAGPRPALLFVSALLATGALGVGTYAWLRPAAAPAPPIPTPIPTPVPAPIPAPVPAPAPAPALAAFDALADFKRIVAAQAPDHKVEVSLVRTTVRSEKDAIEFTVKSQSDGYLYVYNHGSDGSLLRLYPNRISGLPRVRKNVALNLPTDVDFKISGPSGANQLLVMVSALQRDHSALPERDEGGFAFYPTGDAANALSQRHTGPLPWIAGVPKCPPGGSGCSDVFGATIVGFNVVQ
ncbi:MAG: serine/threonine-protein kinase [Rubrivivax sp.]